MVRPRSILNSHPLGSAALLGLGAAAVGAVGLVGLPAAGLAAQDFAQDFNAAPADAAAPPGTSEPTPFGPPVRPEPFGFITPGPGPVVPDWAAPADSASEEPAFADPAPDEPAFDARPFDGDDAGAAGSVPGAASVEPVLRAVYRPHPSRAGAVAEFLRAHAAAGIDVTPRPSTAEGAGSGATELVVVAPAEVQRALGAFLQLCVSADPAATRDSGGRPAGDPDPLTDGGFDEESEFGPYAPPPGYQTPEAGDFSAARTAPADGFGAAPDAFDGDFFDGDSTPLAADDGEDEFFGEDSDGGFADFDGDDAFGGDPAGRTTRRVPPAAPGGE